MSVPRPSLTIIVPFHKGLGFLERALSALVPLHENDELIVVADGALDDCHELAESFGARVIDIDGPKGPAVARNVAAASSRGGVLLFVDADVVAAVDTVQRVATTFSRDPGLAAVFGSYDDQPAAPGFVAQYKNLAHAFVHQDSAGPAKTFWAGFGAVRRAAFLAVGGFDERFERPSIEDIDLGYRLTAAGYRILLDPSLSVCHLKRWTLRSMVASDVFDRGIPWTQLILRYRQFGGNLNMKGSYRACVIVAYLGLGSAGLAVFDVRLLWGVAASIAALGYLGRRYYRFFLEKRGFVFALRVFPLHVLYHLYNGFSFVVGAVLFLVARRLGVSLPGAVPPYPPTTGASSLPSPSSSRRSVRTPGIAAEP